MEKMKLYNGTKAEKIIFVVFGFLVLFIGFISYMAFQEDNKFAKEGIRVEATVNSVSSYGTSKSKSYKMSISMFTQGEKTVVHTDTTGKSEGDKVLDKIFDDIKSNTRSRGDFKMVDISIGSTSYNKYKPGDKVMVVYLKENPDKVKLLSEVE
jgi:hypothetical protein